MNVLVTLDANYLLPLKTMLKSLFMNNPSEIFTIYLMHASLTREEISAVTAFVENHDCHVVDLKVPEDSFRDAPTLLHYTKEMYFRLLAYKILPQDLDRILYLDPDILVINPVRDLYKLDFEGNYYAAAYHDLIPITEINKIRMYPYRIESYYNSGVLLMNLELLRQEADENDVYEFIKKHKTRLIMPDQDILNAVYSQKIKSLDEKIYNYDTRFYRFYKLASGDEYDMEEVINQTVFLHFCGRKKPWHKKYTGMFHALYQHYQKLSERSSS